MCVTLPSSLRTVTSRQPESRSYPYPRCLYRQSRSRSRPTHAGPTQNRPPASTIGLSVVLTESASAGIAVRAAVSTRIEPSVFIAGLLPVTENDKLVGMITDRDIAIRGVAEGKGPDTKVRDAMSPEIKYCFEDEDVAHVAENMAELQVRRLPVMNRDKLLVGIVSLADLAIEGSLPKTAKALHGISQPGGPHNQSRPLVS